jgi:hypothetical protein
LRFEGNEGKTEFGWQNRLEDSPAGPISVLMRTAKALPFVSIFVLMAGVSFLTAAITSVALPRCSDSAPCFTIANRSGSAALGVKSSNVTGVYQNGRQLTQGPGADYDVETGTHGKIMVIVHMPANTTGKPELFQAVVK